MVNPSVVHQKDIGRSETDAKPLVRGLRAKPLEAECVSIKQCLSPLYPLYRQVKKRNEYWHEMDIRKLGYYININIFSIELK